MNGTIDPSQSTLSASFGPYVQDMLSRGAGLANLEFLPFTEQRFAGTSPLQQQAFTGYQNLQAPGQFQTATDLFTRAGTAAQGLGFTPGQVTTGLGPVGSVQDYMTPYMSGVTDIAAREARRQADISRQTEQARLAQAGAFGGSRQAIMEAERQRNLGEQIGDITSRGLQSAFDRAQQQRLQEAQLGLRAQEATEQGRQFGARYGLDALTPQLTAAQGLGALAPQIASTERQNLADVLRAGEVQRGIAQQPLDFGYEQFQESMKYPYQQATFMQSLLQGMPLRAPEYQTGASSFGAGMQGGIGGLALYNLLFGEG